MKENKALKPNDDLVMIPKKLKKLKKLKGVDKRGNFDINQTEI